MPQSGAPDKRVYSMNAEGRSRLDEWVNRSDVPRSEFRSGFLLKLMFGHRMSPEALKDVMDGYRRSLLSTLERLTAIVEQMPDGRNCGVHRDLRVSGVSVFSQLKGGGFDDPNAESVRARVLLAEEFDAGSPDLVMLVTPDDGSDSSAAMAAGQALTAEIAAESGVAQAISYWSTENPTLRSDTGDKALVLIRLAGGVEGADAVAKAIVANYDSRGGLQIDTGGPAALGEALGGIIAEDLAIAEAIAVLGTFCRCTSWTTRCS